MKKFFLFLLIVCFLTDVLEGSQWEGRGKGLNPRGGGYTNRGRGNKNNNWQPKENSDGKKDNQNIINIGNEIIITSSNDTTAQDRENFSNQIYEERYEAEKQSPHQILENCNNIFATDWEKPNEVVSGYIDHVTLGVNFAYSSDENNLMSLLNSKEYYKNYYLYTRNGSIQRICSRVIGNRLANSSLEDFVLIKTMLNEFWKNNMFLWTDNDIQKNDGTVKREEKNIIQSFLKNAREKIFGEIRESVCNFGSAIELNYVENIDSERSILSKDLIQRTVQLYATARMIHKLYSKIDDYLNNINEPEIIKPYEDIFDRYAQDIRDASEEDILNLVVPEKVESIKKVKKQQEIIFEAMQKIIKAKEIIEERPETSNLLTSIVSTVKGYIVRNNNMEN